MSTPSAVPPGHPLDEKLMADHEYDGIRELDNDLPEWWVWLFVLTSIWAVVYLLYFHVFGIGYLSADEYRAEMNPAYVRQEIDPHYLGIFPKFVPVYYQDPDQVHEAVARIVIPEERREDDTTTYVALTATTDIDAGRAIFLTKCVSCHGQHGEGGIGPNLTDDYWLHGAGISNVSKTIKFGVPAKGMITWRYELKPEQIARVASFVLTLHGTNPPKPKPPQGEYVAP